MSRSPRWQAPEVGCTNPSSVRLQSLSSRPPCPPGPQTNRPCTPVRGHSPRESPLLVTQVLGAEAGGEGEDLIPMNFYGTGMTPSLDWGPGRERHAFGRAPRPLPARPCSVSELRGLETVRVRCWSAALSSRLRLMSFRRKTTQSQQRCLILPLLSCLVCPPALPGTSPRHWLVPLLHPGEAHTWSGEVHA